MYIGDSERVLGPKNKQDNGQAAITRLKGVRSALIPRVSLLGNIILL